MKITNKFNLPDPIYQAVSKVWRPQADRLSVSQLIQPPLQKYLTIKHWEALEDDASSRLWALLGQGFHYVLEKNTKGEYLAEEKLKIVVYGMAVVGRPDLFYAETLEDYKVVSTFSFSMGEKVDWERQLNVYALMMRNHGFEVKKLQVNAILRDWMHSRVNTANYPPIPFQSMSIEVWSPQKAQDYVQDRVRLFQTQPQFPCSGEDRWMREGKLAVTKQGNKKALRLWDTEEEVERFIREYSAANPKVKLVVTKRDARYIKCESYCVVRDFCPLNITKKEEDGDEPEATQP